jgi:hypothetical protein
LPAKIAEWEKSLGPSRVATTWVPLEVTSAKPTNKTLLKKLDDGSYLASGPALNNTDYNLVAESKLEKITGLMLEVLPDDSLPAFGPGRAGGNFVLSELTMKWGDKAGKRNQKDVEFKDARADFTQATYEVKGAINGKSEGGKDGWAISAKYGEPHYARFSFAEPIGDAKGATFTISLQHRFRDNFLIGRFRLWVTTSTEPLELGLPEDIAAIVKSPERTDQQATTLMSYFRTIEVGLLKKQQALAKAKMPLPDDAQLVKLRAALVAAELPVPIDPKLLQLRADAAMSTKQVANKRLTGAQDLAWALINNPAFLFNR